MINKTAIWFYLVHFLFIFGNTHFFTYLIGAVYLPVLDSILANINTIRFSDDFVCLLSSSSLKYVLSLVLLSHATLMQLNRILNIKIKY